MEVALFSNHGGPASGCGHAARANGHCCRSMPAIVPCWRRVDKAAAEVKTAYGLEHTPHYLQEEPAAERASEGRATRYTGSKAP